MYYIWFGKHRHAMQILCNSNISDGWMDTLPQFIRYLSVFPSFKQCLIGKQQETESCMLSFMLSNTIQYKWLLFFVWFQHNSWLNCVDWQFNTKNYILKSHAFTFRWRTWINKLFVTVVSIIWSSEDVLLLTFRLLLNFMSINGHDLWFLDINITRKRNIIISYVTMMCTTFRRV